MKNEAIPEGVSQRCPKCHKLTCAFDVDKNKISCTACGFEVAVKMMK